jgi:glucose-1-phosphate cytidylyltransferase
MKTVILAGGRGTRIAEESFLRPTPMIEIGGRPILWHIMKIYAHYGLTEFIVCLGYKGYVIKEYFANYFLHASDITIDMASNGITYHTARAEPWRVTLIDTGETTNTGGRILRVRDYLDPDESFCMTYGDGLADVDIAESIAFHRAHGELATMTTVRPQARFGSALVDNHKVVQFYEKPQAQSGVVNGGFFVLNPGVLPQISGDDSSWEHTVLPTLASRKQLAAWQHDRFWQPMDTLREKELLEELWDSGNAPWKVWT